ncbi:MAG: hypothetical protein RL660_3000 [Bacteroidota bacterium]|jgi:hypothetical protein
MKVGVSNTNILKVTAAFFAFCLIVWSCKKRDPFTGCVASFSGVQFNIVNDVSMVADTFGISQASDNRSFRLYAKDQIRGITLLIEANVPMQNVDLKMEEMLRYGKAKATVLKDNKVFISKYGNFGLNIDESGSTKTACGQFFMQDGGEFLVTEGQFRAVPIVIVP